ncbi:MAG: hypothetical protein ACTHMG_07225 [Sphingomonas sp.]
MIIKSIALAVMIAGIGVPASAQQTDNADKPAVKEKPVCRFVDVVDSIIRKRVCHSRDEWRQIDQQNGDSARSTIDSSYRQHAAENR